MLFKLNLISGLHEKHFFNYTLAKINTLINNVIKLNIAISLILCTKLYKTKYIKLNILL